jgi:Bacteriophage head to tail connecting protein
MSAAEDIYQEFERISGDRGIFESVWEDVAAVCLPSYVGMFYGKGERFGTGKPNDINIFDSTAPRGLTRFASVMESLLTPANQTWHLLVPEDRQLMKDRATRIWMEDANRLLFKYRYAPRANFSGQNYQNYVGLGAFGTSCMFIDALAGEPGLRYRAIHLGEIFFAENHQGMIDKAYRRFQLTARQAVQKWGRLGSLPKPITDAAASTKDSEKKFWFLHCVKPREDYQPGRFDFRGMPFASYYVSETEKIVVAEGGYGTFPYSISRYVQAPGRVYGHSPAMEVLPAIKTLNDEKKTMLRTGHKNVDPVLLAHDDGVMDTPSLRAGAVNMGGVNADGRPLIHALPVGNIQAGEKMMEIEINAINDAFLVTLFQILTETPQMTATEVLERTREKGMLLSPTAGRQQSEALGPMIERELDLLMQQRLLPPMPPALRQGGGLYQVQYNSPMSRAQRAEEGSGFMRWAETGLKFALETQNPAAVDWIDVDTAMPELADIMGVPFRWVSSADKVMAARQQRAQAQQTQQAIDAAPSVAALAKNIPSASPRTGTR